MARFLICLFILALPVASALDAQPVSTEAPSLTVNEAVQRAMAYNYAVRNSSLDVAVAEAQIREAWGQLFPRLDVSAGYTRNVVTANPFAGSEAGNLFSSFGSGGWVEYNERTRQDNLAEGRPPNEGTLTLNQYQERLIEGRREAAGGTLPSGGGNPFAVDNQFTTGLSLTQTLYNGAAFAAIEGAETLLSLNRLALDRRQQLIVQEVRNAFYQTLLAQQQVEVAAQSVERTGETLREISTMVQAGVAPKFQRLSAQVELSNLESQLIEIRAQSELSEDRLVFLLGLPVNEPVALRGDLSEEARGRFLTVSGDNAYRIALEQRPDVARARAAVELRGVNINIAEAEYLPSVSAIANLNYVGSVPDDRTGIREDFATPSPFDFTQVETGFFSDSYWNPSLSVGLRFSWNIFNGFQTSARVQQREVELDRAQLQLEQLQASVRLGVEQALRTLRSAWQRIQSQTRNVERADLNYEYAMQRLQVGVIDQLAVREASQQLDQSRLNYLQAVYDFVSARNAFRTSIGVPFAPESDMLFTEAADD